MSSTTELHRGPRVVVVGGGECGARVAHELATGGWPGSIVLLGEEDRPTYERPPLSKAMLVDPDPQPVEPYRDGRLDLPGLTVRPGVQVTAVDTAAGTVTLADGETVGYDRLVLATGARPRRLADLPTEVPVLRTLDDATALREALEAARGTGGRLLVIGAGLIGLEVAASARTLGVEVTVVEAAERALSRAVPEPVAETVLARHRAEGVDLRLATTVSSLERSGGRWRAALSAGTEVAADVVVQAVGALPETTLAEQAGLEVDDGIVVDAQLRTSAPGVWAAGDCCRATVPVAGRAVRLESWRMAHDQAVAVAASLLAGLLAAGASTGTDASAGTGGSPGADGTAGGGAEPAGLQAVPWFWSDQYDLTLQVSGLADLAERWVTRPRPDGTEVLLGLASDGRLVCAAGVGRAQVAKDVRMAERLIAAGAHPDPDALADPALPLRSLLT
ncbi:FAD-dependent oxidoreductase [Janibacter alkaliphilus]|uniref:3-phenylpropionate/trans-cinnamate dioxygenase ferredoxin reductase subunit n=1 Tax=Janibacter alkaliphilus TaxID=1069963 RepID=A0A852X565_9MICO|nr:3-phenylpropionate/trans-cinnamate dioxygenase ferredoxin reductase subunit [Janibacter alkaliphilus]